MAAPPMLAPRLPARQRLHDASVARRSIPAEASWSQRPELTVVGWMCRGCGLGWMGRASGWWIGDRIQFRRGALQRNRQGPRQDRFQEAYGLMGMVHTASRFTLYRCWEPVSSNHCAQLAAPFPDEQEHWLNRIEIQGFGSRHHGQDAQSGLASSLPCRVASSPPDPAGYGQRCAP